MKLKKNIFLLLLLTLICIMLLLQFNKALPLLAAPNIQKIELSTAKVTTDLLNLRQGPSTKYPVITTLKKDQSVYVTAKLGNWYIIYDPSTGNVGSASGNFLKIYDTKSSNTPETQEPSPTKAQQQIPEQKPQEQGTSPSGLTKDELELIETINKVRQEQNLSPLQIDTSLMNVARLKAKDLADNNYFSHTSPTYGSPFDMMRQFNISFVYAGENIAGNNTVKGACEAWLKSDTHKENILNRNFNYTGVGIVPSNIYGKILVQEFIGR